jgi:hypothetical protein
MMAGADYLPYELTGHLTVRNERHIQGTHTRGIYSPAIDMGFTIYLRHFAALHCQEHPPSDDLRYRYAGAERRSSGNSQEGPPRAQFWVITNRISRLALTRRAGSP